MKNKLSLLLFNFLLIASVFAQKSESNTQFWVNGGLGQSVSKAFTNPGMVGGMGFNISNKQQVISFQLNQFWETKKGEEMQGDFNE